MHPIKVLSSSRELCFLYRGSAADESEAMNEGRAVQCSHPTWGTSGYDRIWQWRLTPALAPVFLSRVEKEEGKEGVCIARRSAQRRFSFLRRPTDRPTDVCDRKTPARARKREGARGKEGTCYPRSTWRRRRRKPGGKGGRGRERASCARRLSAHSPSRRITRRPLMGPSVDGCSANSSFCVCGETGTFSSDRLRERSRSHLLAFPHGVVSVLSISARPAAAAAAGE